MRSYSLGFRGRASDVAAGAGAARVSDEREARAKTCWFCRRGSPGIGFLFYDSWIIGCRDYGF